MCQEFRHTNLTFTQFYMLMAQSSANINSVLSLMKMMVSKTKTSWQLEPVTVPLQQ